MPQGALTRRPHPPRSRPPPPAYTKGEELVRCFHGFSCVVVCLLECPVLCSLVVNGEGVSPRITPSPPANCALCSMGN